MAKRDCRVKNPKDSRYLKNRHRFFDAYHKITKLRPLPTIRPVHLYRHTGLCKSTFYRHFRSIAHVFPSESADLLEAFQAELAKLFGPPPSPAAPPSANHHELFTFLSIFILRHRTFFATAFTHHQNRLTRQLLWELHPYLTADWRDFGTPTNHHLYLTYLAQVELILITWHHQDFHQDRLSATIQRLDTHHLIFYKNLGVFRKIAECQLPK